MDYHQPESALSSVENTVEMFFWISKLWRADHSAISLMPTTVGYRNRQRHVRIGPAIKTLTKPVCTLFSDWPVADRRKAHDPADFALCVLRGLIKPRYSGGGVSSCFDWLALCPRDLNYVSTGAMGQAHYALGLAIGSPDRQV